MIEGVVDMENEKLVVKITPPYLEVDQGEVTHFDEQAMNARAEDGDCVAKMLKSFAALIRNGKVSFVVKADRCDLVHPDDKAVDVFSGFMKDKLADARKKDRSGWDDKQLVSGAMLAQQLVEHLSKPNDGNFLDIANYAMFLHMRYESPTVLAVAMADHVMTRVAAVNYQGRIHGVNVFRPFTRLKKQDIESRVFALENSVSNLQMAVANLSPTADPLYGDKGLNKHD